jgi:hypothetical protein
LKEGLAFLRFFILFIFLKKKKKEVEIWVYFFIGISIPPNTARIANINSVIGTPVFCIGIVLVVVAAFTVVELFPVEPLLPLFCGCMLMFKGVKGLVFWLCVKDVIAGVMV